MRFQDKTVIVTGGAGGIGAAIATRFATEGAQVIVTSAALTLAGLALGLVWQVALHVWLVTTACGYFSAAPY